jgi:regulator of protease activity HflC (stomatin/prohibitin superfamily)
MGLIEWEEVSLKDVLKRILNFLKYVALWFIGFFIIWLLSSFSIINEGQFTMLLQVDTVAVIGLYFIIRYHKSKIK